MESMIGTFIYIPTWRVHGMIIGERPARMGPDDSREFLVQYNPDHEGEWYRLRPTEYEVESLP